MFKKMIYNLIITLLFTSTLFAQNDNNQIPKEETFFIQSAVSFGRNNSGVWDLPGEKDFAIGDQISVSAYKPEKKDPRHKFGLTKGADRKFKIYSSKKSEYVRIRLAEIKGFVDLVGGKSKNGTNIEMNAENNKSSQNFRFKYVNNGRFKIYNENGKMLKLEKKTSANGTKIVLWDEWKGPHTEWVLISEATLKPLMLPNKEKITRRKKDWADMGGIGRFIIQSANNYGKNNGGCFDIPGNENPKKGDNLKVWDLNKGTDRVYSVIQAKNKAYYNIVVGPSIGNDLVVDIAKNGYRNGTNVGIWKLKNNAAQNFYFKHLGKGRYNIFNENGKVIALSNGSSKNGSNIITWVEHGVKSAEWYLIDVDTKKAFIPYPVPSNLSGIKEGNLPGPESRALAANINDTYAEVHKTESRIKALNLKAAGARKALQRTKSSSKSINSLNAMVQRTYDALGAFQRLPLIGTPVTVLSTALNTVKGKLSKANKSVQKLEKSTLGPTLNSAYKINEAMYAVEQNLSGLNKKLFTTKINYNKAASCVTNTKDQTVVSTFESKSKEANRNLTTINNSLAGINKSITELEKIVNSIAKLNKQLGPLEKQIKNIKKAFKETDKIAKEIDKVLNKRFKKKIAGKKVVDISLKKALSATKEVAKFVNKWVSKAINPIIKKLKIKIPGVNIDGLKKELSNLKNSSKLLGKQATKVLDYSKKLKEMKNKLDVSLDDCLNVPPCKFNNDLDLTTIALVETDDEGARSDPTKPLPTKVDLTPNLEFTEGNYNNIINISSQVPMEVRTAKVGDAIDDLFDQAGLTSANSRAADVYTGLGFLGGSPMQTFYIKHQGGGYYSIYNSHTKTALTVVNNSKEEGANIVPQEWKGKDNQLFLIIRDKEKYRYGAFVISKHSGKALSIGKHGSVVQKALSRSDKSQVWAFGSRLIWQNNAGYLGVKKLTLAKEYASISEDSHTAKWNYIVHPSYKNGYYIMNANSTLFLQSEEAYDKNNLLTSYDLVQAPYVVGSSTLMLFYMNYADETKQKINLIEVFTRYIVDVDGADNLILVPAKNGTPLSAWDRFTTVKEAEDSKPRELTEKQDEFVNLLQTMELLTIEEYLQNVSFAEFASVNNDAEDKNYSLLANVLNDFEIDDKVQLIVSMVRGGTENKDDMSTMAILGALTKIDFSQTNDVVEPFKEIAQQSIEDIEKKMKDGISKTYINKLIKNLN